VAALHAAVESRAKSGRSSFAHYESQKIAGLACFYNEKVDLYLDGELQERVRTKFS
jgi:hypothetical protein